MTTPVPGIGRGPILPGSGGPLTIPSSIIPSKTPPSAKPTKPVVIKPPPAKKPPKPQSPLDKWLAGDTTYQGQLSDLNREESAYQANTNRQNQVTNSNFAATQRQMNTQATTDRSDQQYDFAGRGILHSGVYAKALADYNTGFNAQVNNLVQGKTNTLDQSAADLSDFLRQISLQKNSSKQDAIRRRQQSLGL